MEFRVEIRLAGARQQWGQDKSRGEAGMLGCYGTKVKAVVIRLVGQPMR